MFRFLSLILVGFVCFYLVLNLGFPSITFAGLSSGRRRLVEVGLLGRCGWVEGVCERSSEVGCGIFLCGLIFGVKTENELLVGLSKAALGVTLL